MVLLYPGFNSMLESVNYFMSASNDQSFKRKGTLLYVTMVLFTLHA